MRSGKDQVRARQDYGGSEKGPRATKVAGSDRVRQKQGGSYKGHTRVIQGSCRPKKVNVRVR